MRGDLELSWMDVAREPVSCRPQNERRGLTFRDLDVGSYGFTEMPELIRENRSFAPRGAAMPEGLPDLQAEVNRKSEVWAYNVEGYYEEAMTRQWNATTDIPWGELQEIDLPEDIGKAYAQLLTFLTEVEMIATDVPAKWLGRLNADFFEVKTFIATQAMDEARHVGYGMQHLKWVLDHFPEKRELIHHHLDEAENFVFGGGYATEVLEPFIILSGKGLKKENVAQGARITNAFQMKQSEEYF